VPVHASPGQRLGFRNLLIALGHEGAHGPSALSGRTTLLRARYPGRCPGLVTSAPLARHDGHAFIRRKLLRGVYEKGSSDSQSESDCCNCQSMNKSFARESRPRWFLLLLRQYFQNFLRLKAWTDNRAERRPEISPESHNARNALRASNVSEYRNNQTT